MAYTESIFGISLLIFLLKIVVVSIICCYKARSRNNRSVLPDSGLPVCAMDKFLNDMEREKPISFTSQQLRTATKNYRHLLGAGGFGAVYKGSFPNGVKVAVKVLNGSSSRRIEQQFMAEVSTIGRIHHLNLVRLYGFCFERGVRALVYEYMENGSLDWHLFCDNKTIPWEKLHDIAVGTAKGISYLHEECQQRIIHYDIKPGNILLDANLCPKVADFGLAKLCNRDNTHMSMTGGRGTPGYAAPELWLPFPVTLKCDVYSFGMLLFEIIGRRKNMDVNQPESREWLPKWVWSKFERGEVNEMMDLCGIEEKDREKAERMGKVALWCVQDRPENRPWMSVVVKMLEGGTEIPIPSRPSKHYGMGTTPPHQFACPAIGETGFVPQFTALPTALHVCSTPVMKKYEIGIAASSSSS